MGLVLLLLLWLVAPGLLLWRALLRLARGLGLLLLPLMLLQRRRGALRIVGPDPSPRDADPGPSCTGLARY